MSQPSGMSREIQGCPSQAPGLFKNVPNDLAENHDRLPVLSIL
jgi:hypothetical protein